MNASFYAPKKDISFTNREKQLVKCLTQSPAKLKHTVIGNRGDCPDSPYLKRMLLQSREKERMGLQNTQTNEMFQTPEYIRETHNYSDMI